MSMSNPTQQYITRTRVRGKRASKPLEMSKEQAQVADSYLRTVEKEAGNEVCFRRMSGSNTFEDRSIAKQAALAILRRAVQNGQERGSLAVVIDPCPNPEGGSNLWQVWMRKVQRANGGAGKQRANASAFA